MSALDDLLGEFESNVGTMPQVNPPEAAKVLATQTAPEVAGEPEPPPVEEAPPAPTEKPADVKAAEAAKTRKPRGSKATSAATAQPPEGWDNAPGSAPVQVVLGGPVTIEGGDILAALKLLAGVLPPNVKVEIVGAKP